MLNIENTILLLKLEQINNPEKLGRPKEDTITNKINFISKIDATR